MGLADLLFGSQNPFSQFVDANGNKIAGIGAGLAAGPDFSTGLARAAQNSFAARPADTAYATQQKAEADRQANITKTAQWLQKNYPQFSSLPVDQGFQLAAQLQAKTEAANAPQADPSSVAEYKFYANQMLQNGQKPLSYLEYQTQRGGANELSLTPTYLQGPNGDVTMGQANRQGQVVPSKIPDGYTIVDPAEMAATKAQKIADEKNAAAARNALPGVEQAYAVTQQALHQLRADPSVMQGQAENFGNVLGVPQQYLPSIRGTNRANFQNVIKQLSGQAFLNIRQALKGAGQVTDFEGQKGEEAISRMKDAAASGDSEAFNQAVTDFETALNNGVRLLKEQAQGGFSAGSPNVTGAGDPSVDALVNQILGQ